MIFYMIFLMIHKETIYYKVQVSAGDVETHWIGWKFLDVL